MHQVIHFLAVRAVGVFATIILAGFGMFEFLTCFILEVKENIELKGKVERLQLQQLEELKTKNIKVNNSKTK